MKTRIFALFFLLFSISVFGNIGTNVEIRTLHQKCDSICGKNRIMNSKIDSLTSINRDISKELSLTEKEIESLKEVHTTILEGISTQINTSMFLLAIIGVIITITGIGLGIYINHIYNNVIKASKANDLIHEKVSEVNDMINNNVNALYTKIKREETVGLLNRLCEIPEDISNITPLLLSRDLEANDFEKLHCAFLLYKQHSDSSNLFNYYMVLFQHFFLQTLKDPVLRNDMASKYVQLINAAFKNDILKANKDFAKATIDLNITSCSDMINRYMNVLSTSRYSMDPDIYRSIYVNLINKENKFCFYTLLNVDNPICKIEYGKLLVLEYSSQELLQSERQMLEEISRQIGLVPEQATDNVDN